MSIENFQPTIWSKEILVSLKKSLVFSQPGVINRNYEGEIRAAGDTVKINAVGPVSVGDYVKNSDISAPQELVDASTFFTITKQKFFNFQVDDVDAAQNNVALMGQAMVEAGYALANVQDQYVAGLMAAASTNTIGSIGSPKTISAATDAYNFLVDAQVKLAEANVPAGRFAIVPPWFYALMQKDNRFVQTPTTPSIINLISTGQMGDVAGLSVIQSNNVVNDGTNAGGTGANYTIQLGHQMATTYADQVVEVAAYRPEKRFADAIKGLAVYDAKVIRPEALCTLVVTRP